MSSFVSTAKAAAQLAAKQAEKTKLTTITLPSAYRALGQESFAARKHLADFPELHQQLDSIQSEVANLAAQQAAKPAPQSFGDKAKATAGKAMQMAQSQKLSMQQSSLLGSLGKAVYEQQGDASGTQQEIGPIRDALARLSILEAEIADLSSHGKGSWITPRRLAIGGIGAIALIALSLFSQMGNKHPTGARSNDTIINVPATELYAAFNNDPIAAETRFKGKWLAVFGTVGVRDNSPKSKPETILIGLKGSSDTDTYVACYFPKSEHENIRLLDSEPQPPIIGKCVGVGQSEYAKTGKSSIEVRLEECTVLPLAPPTSEQSTTAAQTQKKPKSPYDSGFSEGYSIGKYHTDYYNRLPDPADYSGQQKAIFEQQRREYVSNVMQGGIKDFRGIYDLQRTNNADPADIERSKGMIEGYSKALRDAGISP